MPLQPEKFVAFEPSMPILIAPRVDHRFILAVEMLRSGRPIRMRTSGVSMLPSIWPGDVVVVENKASSEIVSGDIVVVARGGKFFVHRLVGKRDSHWITRGDSNPQNDPPFAGVELLGKVSAIHHRRRVMIPRPRVSLAVRTLAWMLCHWDTLRNVTLRAYAFWQNRAPLRRSQEKPGRGAEALAPASPQLRHG